MLRSAVAVVFIRWAIRRTVMLAHERFLVFRIARNPTPLVALTFDDGPHPERTPKLLAVLRAINVPATFFLSAERAVEHPGVGRALARAGMEIGNRSLTHVSLAGRSLSEQAHQVVQGARVIAEIAGCAVALFRPPYGDFDERTLEVVAAAGQTMVLWNVDPHEWTGIDWIETVTRVIADAEAPAIVLMHDSSRATIAAVPRIVAAYRRAGFRFVRASEIRLAAPAPQ